MAPEQIIPLVSSAVALVSAALAIWGQHRVAALSHALATTQKAEERREQRERLMAKYRDPLMHAVFELQSRLFNIVQQDFFGKYVFDRTDDDKDRTYAINHTSYLIAQYLGWLEVIRREMRFLDFGDDIQTKQLSEILDLIADLLRHAKPGGACRLWAGDQRAIGERMTLKGDQGLEVLGYADFVDRVRDVPAFVNLHGEINKLGDRAGHAGACDRLAQLQHRLIDLLDFMDATCVRFPRNKRERVKI